MFTSPQWLWLLLGVVVLAVVYLGAIRRRRSRAMRFANLAMLERLMPSGPNRWRHAPVALLLAALTMLVIALAGPQTHSRVPRERATVIVVIDVSLSMRATDVAPSRLAVAQEAAGRFADELPTSINLGLVTFAGATTTLVAPTTDRTAFKQAVAGLGLAEGTATGDAIQAGLAVLRSFAQQLPAAGEPAPARMILLSDGKQTVPTSDPATPPRGAFLAADQAHAAATPISAVSFGTRFGTVDIAGQPVAVPTADADMQEIARRSGGQFFRAASSPDLRAAYDTLVSQVGYQDALVDAYRPWVIAGTLAIMLALGTAFALGQRLP